MNPNDLQNILADRFDRTRWLEVVREVLPGAATYLTPQEVAPEATRAKSIWQLGEVSLADGKNLAILEIEVAPGVDLARNRAGLRALAARFIDQASYHGVLAVFRTIGRDDWRLTFAARESTYDPTSSDISIRETAPRRYTYLLGPDEICRTPAERLFALRKHGRSAKLTNIVEAFSVEELNREFFRDFCVVFNLIAAELDDRFPEWKKNETTHDLAQQETQILLNRLLFLYFVQRKGWLDRDSRYLVRHFRDHHESRTESASYYEKFLFPVFRILSTEWVSREKTVSHLRDNDPNRHDLPFLNGGLFHDDDLNDDASRRRKGLCISNSTFSRVFDDLLERYNFTIREDSPLDQEVAIDPEMLGKIFEELILREETGETIKGKSKRHDTGSHYTPRPIVHYLCREALATWMESQPPFAGRNDAPNRIASLLALDAGEGIDEIVMQKLRVLLTPDEAGELLRSLEDLRACDPAVGSGAFPIGLLHELLNLAYLTETRARGHDPVGGELAWAYDTKKEFIRRSLYGVDIQERATEICKLRLWLSLMVDHDLGVNPAECDRRSFQNALRKLEPLPNLDFKIRRADSLIDRIHGEPVNLGKLHDSSTARPALGALASAKIGFFNADNAIKKREMHLAIYSALTELAEIALRDARNDLGLVPGDESASRVAELERARLAVVADRVLVKAAMRPGIRVGQKESVIEQLRARFEDNSKPTFVWQLDFAEVFHRSRQVKKRKELLDARPGSQGQAKESRFDIVLGNPPYVRPHHMSAEYKQLLWDRYNTFVKKADLYCCFIEKGVSLLTLEGCLSFIASHGFLRLDSFQELRSFLLRFTRLRRLIDITDYVFESAMVKTALLVVKSGKPNGNAVGVASVPHNAKFADLPLNYIDQTFFQTAYANVFDVSSNPQSAEIKARMAGMGASVKVSFDISFGIKTGDDSRFLSFEKKGNEYKPLLRGEDIGRYSYIFKGEYVWFNPDLMRKHRKTARPGTRDRYEQPKVLVRDTGEGLRATYECEDYYVKDVLVVSHPTKNETALKFLTGALNSRAMRFYYETTFPTLHVQKNELEVLPVPNCETRERKIVAEMVDIVLFLNSQATVQNITSSVPRDPLIAQFFELWVDAMFYQLFFPEEIQVAKLDFFALFRDANLPALNKGDHMPQLRSNFERLYDPSHPLRGALFALQSLDLVRTIEGEK